MKRIIVMALLCLCLSGCNDKQNENKEIEDTKNKLTDDVNIKVEDNNIFDGLLIVNKNSLSPQFGIEVDDVEGYFAAIPYDTGTKIYIAFKPVKEKSEKVKKAMDLYLDSMINKLTNTELTENGETKNLNQASIDLINNCLKTEYNGYYVYIVDSNPETILENIKPYLT